MGSLNGDTMVVRNGRSTSQVSVYNYPEHLNPFYEDDQHKRLRFWKISKKDNEGRRNSFSIANLKDIWAFKSFRMKKKSSTLGINKTSESPPLLRRDYLLDNGWNTFDNRLRASNTSSINGDSFQRNATYRSSLQTLPTNHDRIGLNRNDGYRSTIQVPRSNSRYQPQQKHHQSNLGVLQNRRSSQSSMVSTNPFESDDDENEDLKNGMRSVMNGSITTLTSRTPRKKRRAPAPPTPIHGLSNGVPPPTIRIESSQDNIQDELHINEDTDIANLTAEIESFVKTKSIDDIEETPKEEIIKTTKTTAADNKENLKDFKVEEENQLQNVNSNTTSAKEIVNATEQANVQVTIETKTATTTTKIDPDAIRPGENVTKFNLVSSESETKTEEHADIKTNGAIPKKPNNYSVSHINNNPTVELQQPNKIVEELCIKETCTDDIEMPPKPIPLKRQTKPETEAGQVECIHVHVESPKASPRQQHPNVLTSFKTTECVESTDCITTKTPFVLTSPPTQRRKQQQNESAEPVKSETVKIIETDTKSKLTNELNIEEEHIHNKPEILIKPALSPKPVTKGLNDKVSGYADIHKPMRRHNQSGHIVKAAREGSISPPFVPQHKTKKVEEKINNTDQFRNNDIAEEKSSVTKSLQFENFDNLKIVETAKKSNGDLKQEEKEKHMEEETNNNSISSAADHQEEQQKRYDELDLLYRPKPSSYLEWKSSTLAPLETNIPPEKRKSVKDIIESINRSQRLLNAAANKDFPALQNQHTTSNNTVSETTFATHESSLYHKSEDLKILNEQQEELERSMEQMRRFSKTEDQAVAANSPSPSPSNDNNDNNEIFQKCKVNKEVFDFRETSPITSNLDWNPVPKPKRTKAAQD